MVQDLWQHMSGVSSATTVPVDHPWNYNIRSQIFCQNQEEHDYLSSLNLMHGREIEIHIWGEWIGLRAATSGKIKVLPIAYTTMPINLRGF